MTKKKQDTGNTASKAQSKKQEIVSPPTYMAIDLNEGDIRNDFSKIADSMRAIRAQHIIDGNVGDETKNEYLHLTNRLASTVEGLADKTISKNMGNMIEHMNKNPNIINYDYFCESVNENFLKSLDNILIDIKGDNFSNLSDRHHLFNALKFLAVRNASLEQKLPIYDTILPFNSPKILSEILANKGIEATIKDGAVNVSYLSMNENLFFSQIPSLGMPKIRTMLPVQVYEELENLKKQKGRIHRFSDMIPLSKIKDDLIEVEFQIPIYSENEKHNHILLLEDLAQVEIPNKIKENLIWTQENHFTQGKYFQKALTDDENINLNKFQNQLYLGREIGALVLYDVLEKSIEPYIKVSGITCFKNERYPMIYILDNTQREKNNNLESRKTEFDKILGALNSNEKIEDKLSKCFGDIKGMKYFHLQRYGNKGEKIFDSIATPD